jgi:hypothetical protein
LCNVFNSRVNIYIQKVSYRVTLLLHEICIQNMSYDRIFIIYPRERKDYECL